MVFCLEEESSLIVFGGAEVYVVQLLV